MVFWMSQEQLGEKDTKGKVGKEAEIPMVGT